MLKTDKVKKVKRGKKMPNNVNFVNEIDAKEIDWEKARIIFEKYVDEKNPDGATKIFETYDMTEALKVAEALSLYHGECEIQKNDETGHIKVFSLGRNKGRIALQGS